MSVTREAVMQALARISLPDGGDLVSRDLVRALAIEGDRVRFVIEAADPDEARALEPVRAAAEAVLRGLPGVAQVQVVLTAHGPAAKAPPPNLKIGQHPTPQQGGPQRITGVDRILAIASGKGGVGKSTVVVQPRRGAGAAGAAGRAAGCRHLRSVAAAHDGRDRSARPRPTARRSSRCRRMA